MQQGQYGACITQGAQDWQIFQQINGRRSIQLHGTWSRYRLEFELPLVFGQVHTGEAEVFIRIVEEDTARPVLPWQKCETLPDGTWQGCLADVPAGGLYRIETKMTYEGWDGFSLTRGDMVHHIGVGDLYVIAGQSNAAGRAQEPVTDLPSMAVHLLREGGNWDIATHPMADSTRARFTGHYANHNPGHNPFLAFGKRIHAATGWPVGFIMAAYGGAPLRWWNPAENGALFREMLHIIQSCTDSVRGVLWYQGEGDAMENTGSTYAERFANMVHETRRALGSKTLPFFTVQLGRYTGTPDNNTDTAWAEVREAQRSAAHSLPHVYLLPAIDLPLYDAVHISGAGNLVLGERMAACALDTLYNLPRPWRAPEVDRAQPQPDGSLLVHFANIHQEIYDFTLPAPLLPLHLEDGTGIMAPVEYTHQGSSTLCIRYPRPAVAGCLLHGAWQPNPAPAPADKAGLPMLAFYRMPLR